MTPDARRHLAALARAPRAAGSDSEAAARAYVADVLRALGFAVREEPFVFSTAPGRFATPLAGALTTMLLFVAMALAVDGRHRLGLAVLGGGLALVGLAGSWVARRGVLSLPIARRRAVNLVAVAPDAAPRVWLMAHLDSKSQPVSILLRAGGITAHALVLSVAGLLLALDIHLHGAQAHLLAILGLVTAVPMLASVVQDRSPGAADNASGVAAVLEAARILGPRASVGIVITSAEELGLAGARAWVRGRQPAIALNCDTTDDVGTLVAMYTGVRPALVADAMEQAGVETGEAVRVRRLLPGILTDGVALADAGWQTATLSKGTLATLGRIHLPADRLEAIEGNGSEQAARVLAAAAARLARGAVA